MVGFYPLFMWRLGRGLPRTQVFFISQLMLQSCDNPTNMLTDFNLVVGFWFCENKYFHRRKVLPMKYRSPQDRATGRHRCWWVKLSSRRDFTKIAKTIKAVFSNLIPTGKSSLANVLVGRAHNYQGGGFSQGCFKVPFQTVGLHFET